MFVHVLKIHVCVIYGNSIWNGYKYKRSSKNYFCHLNVYHWYCPTIISGNCIWVWFSVLFSDNSVCVTFVSPANTHFSGLPAIDSIQYIFCNTHVKFVAHALISVTLNACLQYLLLSSIQPIL